MLELIQFTDPVCTWCWGSEPLLQRLKTHYKGQLAIRTVAGGLVKDIRLMHDPRHQIGGDPAASNAAIAKHWLDASKHHGMPVKAEGFALFSEAHPSSYPQNIAYKAAQLQDLDLAESYLRRIREQTACGSLQTNRKPILLALAKEIGLDPVQLDKDMEGAGLEAFKDDLALAAQWGIRSFPTFLLRKGERLIQLPGLPSFQDMDQAILKLSDGQLRPEVPDATDAALFAFVKNLGRVAPVELSAVFDLHPDASARWLADQVASGRLKRLPAGNGALYALAS